MAIASIGGFCKTQMDFITNEQMGLYVSVETDRLFMRSVEEEDLNNCVSLFGNETVMERFAAGKTRTAAETVERINTWIQRRKEGSPFHAFAVFLKGGDGREQFIGIAALNPGVQPGEAELSGLGYEAFWKQGYGTEAARALVYDYAPILVEQGYQVKGRRFRKIVATARVDNGSDTIIRKVGMQFVKAEETHGALRNHYAFNLVDPMVEAPKKTGSWCVLL